MPSLKELRNRKNSVKSTRKITSAMKMISAAKLKKAQEQVETGRPYSDLMTQMLGALIRKTESFEDPPPLLVGRNRYDSYLIVVVASDRGLCGGFNNGVVRDVIAHTQQIVDSGQTLKIICVGKKARDLLKVTHGSFIIETFPAFARPTFRDASIISEKILKLFETEEIDICRIIYNDFISPLTQKVHVHQLIPFAPLEEQKELLENMETEAEDTTQPIADKFIFEPNEEEVLNALLPRNLSVQIYRALMENAASEYGARMTAMDNATRNATEMIRDLQLKYNRTRQAYITKELIEVISGAEAL